MSQQQQPSWLTPFERMVRSNPSDWTLACLAPLSVRQLQGLCELMGIPYSGTREEITARLLTAARLRTLLATAEKPEDLTGAYKLRELQGFCIEVGVFRGTNKYSAAAALLNWRNSCRRKGQSALERARETTKKKPRVQTAMAFSGGEA